MTRHRSSVNDYVLQVHEDTHRYIQELLRENERLRELAASLDKERIALERQLSAARSDLETQSQDRDELERKLDEIEGENRRYTERYVGIEKQNVDLANLYVASNLLHAPLDRQEALSIVEQIIVNLVGSEELAIFERSPEGSSWSIATAIGVDAERLEELLADITEGRGAIGKSAMEAERYIADHRTQAGRSDTESELVACIPLAVDGDVHGIVTVFGLLGQKAGLERIDLELFDLLATHAAAALYPTWAHAEQSDAAAAQQEASPFWAPLR